MTKFLLLLICLGSYSFQTDTSVIDRYVTIKIYIYRHDGNTGVTTMPELKPDSKPATYSRRFDYLLVNVPEIHLPEKSKQRKEIWDLYPDTTKIKRLFLNEYMQDERLVGYFEETIAPIENPTIEISKTFTVDELMEVASKFFYCDKVLPDTSVQAHVCIGLNGISRANWERDYTLLEAFCFEAIFSDFDNDTSQIWESFVAEKKVACLQYGTDITSLTRYLENVQTALFGRMRNSETLKEKLLKYYAVNEANLAFRIQEYSGQ